jgi:hypothetical protein
MPHDDANAGKRGNVRIEGIYVVVDAVDEFGLGLRGGGRKANGQDHHYHQEGQQYTIFVAKILIHSILLFYL